MKYFKLNMDMNVSNNVVCHYENDFGIPLDEFFVGRKNLNWDNCFYFFYDKNEGEILTDYLVNDKGWFVVSRKFKHLLEIMNTEIQFLPVKIIERKSGKEYTYYIANILRLVDALCLDNSEYFETEILGIGIIYTISKFAIYEKKVKNSDIFKLSNRQEIPIFVSEKFKKIIEKNRITGVSLREIVVV